MKSREYTEETIYRTRPDDVKTKARLRQQDKAKRRPPAANACAHSFESSAGQDTIKARLCQDNTRWGQDNTEQAKAKKSQGQGQDKEETRKNRRQGQYKPRQSQVKAGSRSIQHQGEDKKREKDRIRQDATKTQNLRRQPQDKKR